MTRLVGVLAVSIPFESEFGCQVQPRVGRVTQAREQQRPPAPIQRVLVGLVLGRWALVGSGVHLRAPACLELVVSARVVEPGSPATCLRRIHEPVVTSAAIDADRDLAPAAQHFRVVVATTEVETYLQRGLRVERSLEVGLGSLAASIVLESDLQVEFAVLFVLKLGVFILVGCLDLHPTRYEPVVFERLFGQSIPSLFERVREELTVEVVVGGWQTSDCVLYYVVGELPPRNGCQRIPNRLVQIGEQLTV